MRSTFGKQAQKRRMEMRMSQTEFAGKVGESLSRVSQLEHQRVHISDDVVGKYIEVLDCNGSQAHTLREYAEYSNSRLTAQRRNLPHDDLHALLSQFGGRLTSSSISKIKRIIADEIGEYVTTLEFSNTRSRQIKGRSNKKFHRPPLDPERFVDICLRAEEIRSETCLNNEKLNVEHFLELRSLRDNHFDVDIVEVLPTYSEGAYACLVGQKNTNVLLVEEERYVAACKNQSFGRHVLMHEYAHHVLHSDLLKTDTECYLPPQALAVCSTEDLSSVSDTMIANVVDTSIEVEAECFATVLLVPWPAFMKGTELIHLSRDFGEQLDEVKRYAPYFKNPRVIDLFKKKLWERGKRDHFIFARGN